MLEFMTEHQMFIVLSIVLIVWAGIVLYLFRIDRKVKYLEERLKREA